MKKISIITPIYKGKKYLPNLTQMVEKNAMSAKEICCVDWVIVNDYPQDYIKRVPVDNSICLKVINNKNNIGIQGSRVTGLKACEGDYVLFLDQDDWISSEWVRSQIEHIGEADVVVCDSTNDGRLKYGIGDVPSQEKCVTKDYNLYRSGFLLGQALIKKSSIPELWKNKWLKWNCYDDYLLSLCMYSCGCIFVCNKNILYDHKTTFSNQSLNSYEWYKSMMEMVEYVKCNHLFSESEIAVFVDSRMRIVEESFKDKTWITKKMGIYKDLLSVYEKDLTLSNCIVGKKSKRILIYGLTMGRHIYQRLRYEGLNILGFIDRNADNIKIEIPIFRVEDIPQDIDIVINTLIRDEEEVKKNLLEHNPNMEVISVREMLDSVL